MGIQSNSSTAGTHAQNIMNAANGIPSYNTVSKDGTSSFAGNTQASSNIDKEQSNANSINEQLKAFIANVHTIASEFEAVDHGISVSLSNPLFTSGPFSFPATSSDTSSEGKLYTLNGK